MRRAPIIVSAISVTLALALLLVLGIVAANRDRLGIGDPIPAASGAAASDVLRPRTGEDPEWGSTAIYDVLDDGSLSPAASGLAAEVWATFERVATPAFAAEVILSYTVGDSVDADLLAYVQQDSERPEYWHLAVNLAGATDMSYLLTTLVHEYAHLLTLNRDQTPPDATCEVVAPSEGCWADDAYLRAFWDEFWSGYGDRAPAIATDDLALRESFYAQHEEDFVSSYAAKNVEEDIAESFMAYVVEPVPGPPRTRVAAKLAFFDRYPELAAIRERIRAEFGDLLRPVWDP